MGNTSGSLKAVISGKDVPVPVKLITHLLIVAIVTPRNVSEEQYWIKEGVDMVFINTHSALAAILYDSDIIIQKALFKRAIGHSTKPDKGSIKAAIDLLKGADRTSCVMIKHGVVEINLGDKNVDSCGFIVILCFPPPPGMKPWTEFIAPNRPLVPSKKLAILNEDGSLLEVDAEEFYASRQKTVKDDNSSGTSRKG